MCSKRFRTTVEIFGYTDNTYWLIGDWSPENFSPESFQHHQIKFPFTQLPWFFSCWVEGGQYLIFPIQDFCMKTRHITGPLIDPAAALKCGPPSESEIRGPTLGPIRWVSAGSSDASQSIRPQVKCQRESPLAALNAKGSRAVMLFMFKSWRAYSTGGAEANGVSVAGFNFHELHSVCDVTFYLLYYLT